MSYEDPEIEDLIKSMNNRFNPISVAEIARRYGAVIRAHYNLLAKNSIKSSEELAGAIRSYKEVSPEIRNFLSSDIDIAKLEELCG